ncbi:MAG: peptidylprolyl isomerase [Chloroflexota bacterium]
MKANKVAKNMVVGLTYALRLDDEQLVDEADAKAPLFFLVGHENIIPGLERELIGMAVGETKKVTVKPADGYGDYDDEDQDKLPRDVFGDELLFPGMDIELHDEETGDVFDAIVVEVDDETVTLDFNHPLAGETLFFEVTVVELRPATAEEIDHGHVHE